MGKLKYFFVILASVAVAILFQNCGDIRLNPGSESLNSTSDPLSCVDPSGSSPTVVVSSLSEADQSNLNAHVLETRFSDNQTLTSTRTFEWSFDENPQPAGANLSVNVAQLVACSTHKVTAKWIDSCSQPQELTQIYTQYGEGCPPPPEPAPEPTPPSAPAPTPPSAEPVNLCGTAANSLNGAILTNIYESVDFMLARGQNNRFTVSRGESRSIQITTGAAPWVGSFGMSPDPIGRNVIKFMNVSLSPCDFTYTNLDALNGCAASAGNPVVQYVVEETPLSTTKCSLRPHTTYYINIRNEWAGSFQNEGTRGSDTCPPTAVCGTVFVLRGN